MYRRINKIFFKISISRKYLIIRIVVYSNENLFNLENVLIARVIFEIR